MKDLSDEMLNKYIDGDLDSKSIQELKELVAHDQNALDKLKAHKIIDQILKELEPDHVSEGFTERVMKKIYDTVSVKNKKSGFFTSVLTLFVLGIIATITATLILVPGGESKDNVSENIVNTTQDILSKSSSLFESFFSSGNILIVGAFLTFILLISGYFMLNTHKSLMQKLNNY